MYLGNNLYKVFSRQVFNKLIVFFKYIGFKTDIFIKYQKTLIILTSSKQQGLYIGTNTLIISGTNGKGLIKEKQKIL